MRSVSLKVLKNKLSEYVRLAERGETILVRDGDRVVAEIVPPEPGACRCDVGRGCAPGLDYAAGVFVEGRATAQSGDALSRAQT